MDYASSTSFAIINFNDSLKVNIYGHTRPKIVPKLLLQVSIREILNSLVSDPNDGGIKEARDAENNIIINYYTLRSLFPPELKKMSEQFKVMYGSKCCISTKSIHYSLLSWRDRYLKTQRSNPKWIKIEFLVKKKSHI